MPIAKRVSNSPAGGKTARVSGAPAGGQTSRIENGLLLEGDMQETGNDFLLLEGDAQEGGGDHLALEGDVAVMATTTTKRVSGAAAEWSNHTSRISFLLALEGMRAATSCWKATHRRSGRGEARRRRSRGRRNGDQEGGGMTKKALSSLPQEAVTDTGDDLYGVVGANSRKVPVASILNLLSTVLASTQNGKGASTIGIVDADGYYDAANVEAALAEAAEFEQAGAGAVTRTKLEKLREWVSLEDFGVVPGLSVSDTVAEANVVKAQAALDYCETEGKNISCAGQFYVFKDDGLRIPSSVHCYGQGVGYWEPIFHSRPKTWGGTSWIFKGTGTADVEITGITSMKYAGGWRPDPDNPGEYFKLTSFMNDDASGTTPATPRAVSVAVTGKGIAATDWGLHGIRVVPWLGTDGISDYSDTGNSALSDDWDIGVLLLDNEYVQLHDGQAVGYWRVAGTAVISPGFDAAGRSEQISIRNWKTTGVRGLLIRASDVWAVSARTSSTVTIRWSEESYWPSGGGSFEGLGSGSSPTYTYTSTSRDGDNLVFNGVSPDPTVAAPFQIRNANRGTGFAHCQVEKTLCYGLDHESGDDSETLGLPMSGCFEISGFPMRGWHFQNFKTQTLVERLNAFLHDADDTHFFDWQAEGGADNFLIATPVTGDQSWAEAPCVDTRNLRIYASASFGTSANTDLFTPRSYLDDARQINPIDELDGNLLFRALPGQDMKLELSDGGSFIVQDSDEATLLEIDEATGAANFSDSVKADNFVVNGYTIPSGESGFYKPTTHTVGVFLNGAHVGRYVDGGLLMGDSSAPSQMRPFHGSSAVSQDNVQYPFRAFHRRTSGTSGVGLGVGYEMALRDASGNDDVAGTIETEWTNATHGSENADCVIKLMRSGAAAAEKARIRSDGAMVPGSPRLSCAEFGTWHILAASAVQASHTGDTSETVLATITIPADAMGPNGAVRVTTLWTHTNSANNKTLRVRFGGVSGTQYLSSNVTTTQATRHQAEIHNRNDTASQVGGASGSANSFNPTANAINTSTEDTTEDIDIVISGQLANSGETIALEYHLVEVIYGP